MSAESDQEQSTEGEEQRRRARTPSRRRWRPLFRRARLYVPLIVLIPVILIVFLPLSPPWLARKLEQKLREKTGLDVTLERVRVHLWQGEVRASGVALQPVEPGGEAFEVGEVVLTGPLSELLAGQGRWPAVLRVENVSDLIVVQDKEGTVLPVGSLETLLNAVETLERLDTSPEGQKDPLEALERPTPEVILRNARLQAYPASSTVPPLRVSLQDLRIAPRTGPGDPITGTFQGIAIAGSAEPIHGTLQLLPADEQARLNLHVAGLRLIFPIGQFGTLETRSRGIGLDLEALRTRDGLLRVNFDTTVTGFQLREARVGGERWQEDELRLRLRGSYQPDAQRVRLESLDLLGDEIALEAEGNLEHRGNLPGSARVQVRRLPDSIIRIGRNLAAQEGVLVERATSSSLLLDLTLKGPFQRPLPLIAQDASGTVALAGWNVAGPGWPMPLRILQGSGTISGEALELPEVQVALGDLVASARVSFPLPNRAEPVTTPTLELTLRGEPEAAVATAKAFRVLPRELVDLTTPLSLSLAVRPRVELNPNGSLTWTVLAETEETLRGTLSWGAGMVVMRDLPEGIRLAPGSLQLRGGDASLDQLRATYRGFAVDLSATVEGLARAQANPADAHFDVAVGLNGPVRRGIELVNHFTPLPPRVAALTTGTLRLSAEARGNLAEPELASYTGWLALSGAAGEIPLPAGTLNVRDVALNLDATPEEVRLRRLSAAFGEFGTVEGEGRISGGGAYVDLKVNSPLSLAEQVAPRDLQDFVMEGSAYAEATGSVEPTVPLPEGPDVARRWLAAMAGPQPLSLGIHDNSPLKLDIQGRIVPQPGGVTFFHRDLPQPLTKVRGDVTVDETGIAFRNVRANAGASEDVQLNGFLQFGHVNGIPNFTFEAKAGMLDLNDWLEGWGEKEWAERGNLVPPSLPRPRGEPRLRVRIDGSIELAETRFLKSRAEDALFTLRYESWRDAPNRLIVPTVRAQLYGGPLQGDAELTFPEEDGALTQFRAAATTRDSQSQGFFEDLLEKPIDFRGLFTGGGSLSGEVGDYATWRGSGDFVVHESNLIGSVALRALVRALNLGREGDDVPPTSIRGSWLIEDMVARFPDLRAENRQVMIVADGALDFNGRVDFLLFVSVLSNRLKNVPLMKPVGSLIDRIGDQLISYRMQGTVKNYEVKPTPLGLDKLPFFSNEKSGERVLSADEARRSGRGVLGRGIRFAIKAPGSSEDKQED